MSLNFNYKYDSLSAKLPYRKTSPIPLKEDRRPTRLKHKHGAGGEDELSINEMTPSLMKTFANLLSHSVQSHVGICCEIEKFCFSRGFTLGHGVILQICCATSLRFAVAAHSLHALAHCAQRGQQGAGAVRRDPCTSATSTVDRVD